MNLRGVSSFCTITAVALVGGLLISQPSALAAANVGKSQSAKAASVKAGVAASVSVPKSDRELMKAARAEFEKKNFKQALVLYEAVPADSDYWTEALEERGWAHVHLMEHDQALALVKTLFAPPVKFEIGAEPYLLSSLIQLRLCNYKELFKVMDRFKTDIRPRYEALKALAKTGTSEAATRAIAQMQTTPSAQAFTRAAAGSDVSVLPRLFYRDQKIQDAIKASASTSPIKAISARMKALAARDVADIDGVLRKMHLVEVESVQRMHSHLHLADKKKTTPKLESNANILEFPDDENDVWLDEVDSYRVDAKGCPGLPISAPKTVAEGPKS